MSFLLAGAVLGTGVLNYMQGEQNRKMQRNALDRQGSIEQQKLNFAKEQYDDFRDTYGDVEENLSGYYKNLDPNSFAAKQVSEFTEQYKDVQQRHQKSLARSGNLTANELNENAGLEMQQALGAAQIRGTADEQVAQAQQGFLNQGRSSDPSQRVLSGYEGVANNAGNRANYYGQQSQSNYQVAGDLLQSSAYILNRERQAPQQAPIDNELPRVPSRRFNNPYS